jgi:hypothetical protein
MIAVRLFGQMARYLRSVAGQFTTTVSRIVDDRSAAVIKKVAVKGDRVLAARARQRNPAGKERLGGSRLE